MRTGCGHLLAGCWGRGLRTDLHDLAPCICRETGGLVNRTAVYQWIQAMTVFQCRVPSVTCASARPHASNEPLTRLLLAPAPNRLMDALTSLVAKLAQYRPTSPAAALLLSLPILLALIMPLFGLNRFPLENKVRAPVMQLRLTDEVCPSRATALMHQAAASTECLHSWRLTRTRSLARQAVRNQRSARYHRRSDHRQTRERAPGGRGGPASCAACALTKR